MINRITSSMMTTASGRNLQKATSDLAKAQEQASTLKKITRPSDDPSGTMQAMNVRASIQATEQYMRNTQDGQAWLTAADSALSNVSTLLGRAKDLLVQANNGSLNPAGRAAIAADLDSIRAEMLTAANTKYLDRNVFAGSSDSAKAFNPDFTYNGGSGSVERRIDENTTVRVDVDGNTLFGSGATSVFAELAQISADIRAGNPVGAAQDTIQARFDKTLDIQASVGARQATLIRAEEFQQSSILNLNTSKVDLEDVDAAIAYTQLAMQQQSYQAALQITAKSMPQNLMDFLR